MKTSNQAPPAIKAPFLKKVWALSKPYWTSSDQKRAFALVAALLLLGFLLVRMQVLANTNTRLFYDALQNYQPHLAVHYALLYVAYIVIFALCTTFISYFGNTLLNRWRKWLSVYYLDRWVAHQAFYRLDLVTTGLDNPDQRIADDIEQFTATTLSLFNGLYGTTIQLITFILVLWHLSGTFHLVIHGMKVGIPGYLVWCALAYAALSTLITCWIGRRLSSLNYQQQHFNADFRFGLVRLRENAEQIAMQRGEQAEKAVLITTYQPIFTNFKALIRVGCHLAFFTKTADYLSMMLGTLFALPKFMVEKMSVGDLMQISSAFSYVVNGFSFFMNAYTEIAGWRAVVDRLSEFALKISAADACASQVIRKPDPVDAWELTDLSVSLPTGAVLLASMNQSFKKGERVLIMGAVGSGKSSLLRTLAGVWPFATGTVTQPRGRSLFLSQKPYFPIGSLQAALCFPDASTMHSEQAIHRALKTLNLDRFITRLGEQGHWLQILSLGEQQLLSLVRALLIKPAYLFLDEASSSLDEAREVFVYQCLAKALPDTTIISIGHRSSLIALHDRVLVLSA